MKKIKNIYLYISILSMGLIAISCDSFSDAFDVKKIAPISVTFNTEMGLDNFDDLEGLRIVVTNYTEDLRKEKEMSGSTVTFDNLIPGMYSIVVTGKSENNEGVLYYLNGSLVNRQLLTDKETVKISISGLQISPLVFKEIFYAGTDRYYFRNQFYEIYNNSDELLYLDGLYFANLYPGSATSQLPVWPDEDGDKYIYTDRLWKFPGSGNEYPLQPGESCVISQFAANHQLEIYNPDSPIDGSSSEFEFNMNNPRFPDQPAFDMVHAFYNGLPDMERVPQYLTSVFGGAYVLFKVPDDEQYDPVNNTSLQTRNLASSSTKLYAKIPIKYVLDGVEAVHDETKVDSKRMPGVLDAGITTVGATYNSLGVARKKIGENIDGTPILQDTNNSTDDFERGVVPQFRRYDSKMPSWNHTLN